MIPAGLQDGAVVDTAVCTVFVETIFVDQHCWASTVDVDSHHVHCAEAARIAGSIALVKHVQLADTAGHENYVFAADLAMRNSGVLDFVRSVARMSTVAADNFVNVDIDAVIGLVNSMDTADSGYTVDIVGFAAKPEFADTAEAVGTVHAAT